MLTVITGVRLCAVVVVNLIDGARLAVRAVTGTKHTLLSENGQESAPKAVSRSTLLRDILAPETLEGARGLVSHG